MLFSCILFRMGHGMPCYRLVSNGVQIQLSYSEFVILGIQQLFSCRFNNMFYCYFARAEWLVCKSVVLHNWRKKLVPSSMSWYGWHERTLLSFWCWDDCTWCISLMKYSHLAFNIFLKISTTATVNEETCFLNSHNDVVLLLLLIIKNDFTWLSVLWVTKILNLFQIFFESFLNLFWIFSKSF